MKNEDLTKLLAELTAPLSGVAKRFNVRVAKVVETMPATDILSDAALVERARSLPYRQGIGARDDRPGLKACSSI